MSLLKKRREPEMTNADVRESHVEKPENQKLRKDKGNGGGKGKDKDKDKDKDKPPKPEPPPIIIPPKPSYGGT